VSGSCSRCLVFSLLPCPTLPKQSILVCGYGVNGLSVVQGAVPMLAAHTPSSCNQLQGIRSGRCVHQLSQRVHASSPCLNINHKPIETNKPVEMEPCMRCHGSVVQSGCRGKWRCVGPWQLQAPYFEGQEPLQTCTPCFHTIRTSCSLPEFCYEMSMVCALMACYLL
jgi:hypothetical protein